MARTALTAEKFLATGLIPTPVTPDAAGVSFRNNKRNVLLVKNGAGSSITVTPKIGKTIQGISVTSPAQTLAAGATGYYGPFVDDYEQPGSSSSHDTVFVDLSSVTTVTVSLLEMPLIG